MKIFFVLTSSQIDDAMNGLIRDADHSISHSSSFTDIIRTLNGLGFSSLFGMHSKYLFQEESAPKLFISVANSAFIQQKWARENSMPITDNWVMEILSAQIETFQPDVIYTNNPQWMSKKCFAALPTVKLKAAWRAAPLSNTDDLSHFNLGLSYAPVYTDLLRQHGVKFVEQMDFSFDAQVKHELAGLKPDKKYDICFIGRYNDMFVGRNELLQAIYDKFHKTHRVVYHLLVNRRVRGLIPMIPLKMLRAYRPPVYVNHYLKTFARSKVIFNCHSDISGPYKGNMRVFEALGMAAFMVSDAGIYPKYLQPTRDFIPYMNKQDLLEKISYYLCHETEREAIAQQGYQTISTHYSTEQGVQKLQNIFSKYL